MLRAKLRVDNYFTFPLFFTYKLRAAGIERNKRCLVAYHMKRLEKIREIRWQGGPVIPDHLRTNLSASERTYSHKYNRALAKLMRGSGDLDFTQIQTPPKSLYVEVKSMI